MSDKPYFHMFGMSRKLNGEDKPFIPQFSCNVEKIPKYVIKLTSKDYLLSVKKGFSNSLNNPIFKDIYQESISNKNFDVLEVEQTITIRNKPEKIKQKYYTFIMNGYALNFISSYVGEEDITNINEEVIKGIVLK